MLEGEALTWGRGYPDVEHLEERPHVVTYRMLNSTTFDAMSRSADDAFNASPPIEPVGPHTERGWN